jgi:hypothetical protein
LWHREAKGMAKIKINKTLLQMAFETDSDNPIDGVYQEIYLDKKIGDFLWIPKNPSDDGYRGEESGKYIKENRLLVQTYPERFAKVPILNHDAHNAIFTRFLDSKNLVGGYFRLIGGWIEQNADDNLRNEWKNFRDTEFNKISKEWLKRTFPEGYDLSNSAAQITNKESE